jgi:hypothetical protein
LESLRRQPDQGFDTFLEWCIDNVGRRKQSADGHFGNSGPDNRKDVMQPTSISRVYRRRQQILCHGGKIFEIEFLSLPDPSFLKIIENKIE